MYWPFIIAMLKIFLVACIAMAVGDVLAYWLERWWNRFEEWDRREDS